MPQPPCDGHCGSDSESSDSSKNGMQMDLPCSTSITISSCCAEEKVGQLEQALNRAMNYLKSKENLVKIQTEHVRRLEEMYKKTVDENKTLNYKNKKTRQDLENLQICMRARAIDLTSTDTKEIQEDKTPKNEQYSQLKDLIEQQSKKIEALEDELKLTSVNSLRQEVSSLQEKLNSMMCKMCNKRTTPRDSLYMCSMISPPTDDSHLHALVESIPNVELSSNSNQNRYSIRNSEVDEEELNADYYKKEMIKQQKIVETLEYEIEDLRKQKEAIPQKMVNNVVMTSEKYVTLLKQTQDKAQRAEKQISILESQYSITSKTLAETKQKFLKCMQELLKKDVVIQELHEEIDRLKGDLDTLNKKNAQHILNATKELPVEALKEFQKEIDRLQANLDNLKGGQCGIRKSESLNEGKSRLHSTIEHVRYEASIETDSGKLNSTSRNLIKQDDSPKGTFQIMDSPIEMNPPVPAIEQVVTSSTTINVSLVTEVQLCVKRIQLELAGCDDCVQCEVYTLIHQLIDNICPRDDNTDIKEELIECKLQLEQLKNLVHDKAELVEELKQNIAKQQSREDSIEGIKDELTARELRITMLSTQLNEVNKTNRDKVELISKLQQQIAELKKNCQSKTTQKILDLEKKNALLQQEIESFKLQTSDTQEIWQMKEQLREEMRMFKLQLSQLDSSEVVGLRLTVEELQIKCQTVDEAAEKIKHLTDENAKLLQEIESISYDKEGIREKELQLREELGLIKLEVERLKLPEQRDDMQNWKLQIEKKNEDIVKKNEQIENKNKECNELRDSLIECRQAKQALEQQLLTITDTTVDMQDWKNQIETKNQEISKKSQEIEIKSKECTELRGALKECRDEKQALQRELLMNNNRQVGKEEIERKNQEISEKNKQIIKKTHECNELRAALDKCTNERNHENENNKQKVQKVQTRCCACQTDNYEDIFKRDEKQKRELQHHLEMCDGTSSIKEDELEEKNEECIQLQNDLIDCKNIKQQLKRELEEQARLLERSKLECECGKEAFSKQRQILNDCKTHTQELEQELEHQTDLVMKLKMQVEKQKSELEIVRDHRNKRDKVVVDSVEALKDELTIKQKELAKLTTQLSVKNKQVSEATETNVTLKQKMANLLDQINNATLQYEDIKQILDDCKRSRTELELEREHKNKLITELRQYLKKVKMELKILREKVVKDEKVGSTQVDFTNNNKEIEALQNELQNQVSQTNEVVENNCCLQKTVATLLKEIESIRLQYDELHQLLIESNKYNDQCCINNERNSLKMQISELKASLEQFNSLDGDVRNFVNDYKDFKKEIQTVSKENKVLVAENAHLQQKLTSDCECCSEMATKASQERDELMLKLEEILQRFESVQSECEGARTICVEHILAVMEIFKRFQIECEFININNLNKDDQNKIVAIKKPLEIITNTIKEILNDKCFITKENDLLKLDIEGFNKCKEECNNMITEHNIKNNSGSDLKSVLQHVQDLEKDFEKLRIEHQELKLNEANCTQKEDSMQRQIERLLSTVAEITSSIRSSLENEPQDLNQIATVIQSNTELTREVENLRSQLKNMKPMTCNSDCEYETQLKTARLKCEEYRKEMVQLKLILDKACSVKCKYYEMLQKYQEQEKRFNQVMCENTRLRQAFCCNQKQAEEQRCLLYKGQQMYTACIEYKKKFDLMAVLINQYISEHNKYKQATDEIKSRLLQENQRLKALSQTLCSCGRRRDDLLQSTGNLQDLINNMDKEEEEYDRQNMIIIQREAQLTKTITQIQKLKDNLMENTTLLQNSINEQTRPSNLDIEETEISVPQYVCPHRVTLEHPQINTPVFILHKPIDTTDEHMTQTNMEGIRNLEENLPRDPFLRQIVQRKTIRPSSYEQFPVPKYSSQRDTLEQSQTCSTPVFILNQPIGIDSTKESLKRLNETFTEISNISIRGSNNEETEERLSQESSQPVPTYRLRSSTRETNTPMVIVNSPIVNDPNHIRASSSTRPTFEMDTAEQLKPSTSCTSKTRKSKFSQAKFSLDKDVQNESVAGQRLSAQESFQDETIPRYSSIRISSPERSSPIVILNRPNLSDSKQMRATFSTITTIINDTDEQEEPVNTADSEARKSKFSQAKFSLDKDTSVTGQRSSTQELSYDEPVPRDSSVRSSTTPTFVIRQSSSEQADSTPRKSKFSQSKFSLDRDTQNASVAEQIGPRSSTQESSYDEPVPRYSSIRRSTHQTSSPIVILNHPIVKDSNDTRVSDSTTPTFIIPQSIVEQIDSSSSIINEVPRKSKNSHATFLLNKDVQSTSVAAGQRWSTQESPQYEPVPRYSSPHRSTHATSSPIVILNQPVVDDPKDFRASFSNTPTLVMDTADQVDSSSSPIQGPEKTKKSFFRRSKPSLDEDVKKVKSKIPKKSRDSSLPARESITSTSEAKKEKRSTSVDSNELETVYSRKKSKDKKKPSVD